MGLKHLQRFFLSFFFGSFPPDLCCAVGLFFISDPLAKVQEELLVRRISALVQQGVFWGSILRRKDELSCDEQQRKMNKSAIRYN